MRTSLALAIAATLVAAPASAQEANQAGTAEPPTTVDAAPDPALNDVTLPADETVSMAPAPVEPAYESEPAPARDDDEGFPWGLIGLIGLVGLLGRARS